MTSKPSATRSRRPGGRDDVGEQGLFVAEHLELDQVVAVEQLARERQVRTAVSTS
jgi:hypothetical protein